MKEYDVIVYNTKTEWRFNGILHREDGPAIEYIDGGKMWYVNGVKHRDGGPAVVWYNGTKEWWFNGRLHREDGPAIEYPDGNGSWWINGKKTNIPAVELTIAEIETLLGYAIKVVK